MSKESMISNSMSRKCHSPRLGRKRLHRDEQEVSVGEFNEAHMFNHFIVNSPIFRIFWMLYYA